jgi:iron complex outermembrane receptor protein
MFKSLSIVIAVTTLLAHSTAIFAQGASQSENRSLTEDDSEAITEIVVTGTKLRGLAPVGSYVWVADQDDMAEINAINITELSNTIPVLTAFGSAPLGQNGYSHFAPTIHSLGGSLTNSTLVLIDGLRMPGGGIQYGQPDPNIIPTSALQRIEVLADGASSIYGSDAVAGVVNYITRPSFDGVALNGQMQYGDSYEAQDFNGIFGREWDTGGFYAAMQFANQDQLQNASRDFLSRGDYRDIGGLSRLSFRCSPATIRTPASGTGVYLSPDDLTTVPLNDDNAVCNLTGYGSAIPGIRRENALIQVHEKIADRLSVRASLNWNHYKGERDLGPGGLTNATAFGPGSSNVDQINPFFVAPAGETTALRETITWAALREDNQYGVEESENDTTYIVASAEYQISERWAVGLSNAYGRSQHSVDTKDAFNTSDALLALNGTVNTAGNTTTSAIQGQNIVILNLPLTPENALDVWRPAGENLTSQLVLDQLYTNSSYVSHLNEFNQVRAELEGRLFQMRTGDVRFATGIEWLWQEQQIEEVISMQNFDQYGGTRDTYSIYAEVGLPLISEDMGLPLAQSVDLNLSARYDDISDIDSTTNPKIAVDWRLNDEINMRFNWATSFVAQPLNAVGFPEISYRNGLGFAALNSGAVQVPVALYPEVTGVPGCAAATVTCNIGTSQSPGLRRHFRLGPGAEPLEGETWSVGVDWEPSWMPSFVANITFWSQEFENGATSPTPEQIMSNPRTRDRLTICPTGCTQDQISDFATLEAGGTIGNVAPVIYFLIDRSYANIVNLAGQGIDYNLRYLLDTSTMGTFKFGLTGSHLTKMDQKFDGGSTFSVLNTAGFNLAFPSVDTRARFNLGWQRDQLGLGVFVNYIGAYRNWRTTTVTPIERNDEGLPIGGGDKVDDQVTIDLHAEYSFERVTFFVDAKNVSDEDPPFISYNAGGSGLDGYGYNGFTSNPIGRVVSVGFRSAF